MSLAVMLYIIVTLVLFSLNMVANIFSLALSEKKQFPLSTFIATVIAMGFVIWGITILVTN